MPLTKNDRHDLIDRLIADSNGLHVVSSWYSDAALGTMPAELLLGTAMLNKQKAAYSKRWSSEGTLQRPYVDDAVRFRSDCGQIARDCLVLERAVTRKIPSLVGSAQETLQASLGQMPPQDGLLLLLATHIGCGLPLQEPDTEANGSGIIDDIGERLARHAPQYMPDTTWGVEGRWQREFGSTVRHEEMEDYLPAKPTRNVIQAAASGHAPSPTLRSSEVMNRLPELRDALIKMKLFHEETVNEALRAKRLSPADSVFRGNIQFTAGTRLNELSEAALDLTQLAGLPPSVSFACCNFKPSPRSLELDRRFAKDGNIDMIAIGDRRPVRTAQPASP